MYITMEATKKYIIASHINTKIHINTVKRSKKPRRNSESSRGVANPTLHSVNVTRVKSAQTSSTAFCIKTTNAEVAP